MPAPHEPRSQPQQPTVFVYEKPGWEYRVVSRKMADDPLAEDELNALGTDGWELVGVVPMSETVQFYLKRTRR